MSDTPLIQAGEYDFQYVELLIADGDSVDISNQVDALIVYEDIHQPVISGKLILRDTLQIPNFAKFTGRDLLRFQVATKPRAEGVGSESTVQEPLAGLFHIYKHADTALVGDRMQTYTLYFQSLLGMINTNLLAEKAYSGNPSGIIKSIFDEHFPEQTFGVKFSQVDSNSIPTNKVNFVSNMWSPIKSMTYAAKASIGRDDDIYFLYESRYGFKFRSLNYLKSLGLVENLYNNDYNMDTATMGVQLGSARRNPELDYKKVQNVRVDKMFDYLEDTKNGVIKTEQTTYDILNKKIIKSEYAYDYNNVHKLNDNPLWLKSIIEKTPPTQVFSTRTYSNKTDVDSLSLDDVSFIRDAKIRALNQSKIEVDVFGRLVYELGDSVRYHNNMATQIKTIDDINASRDKLTQGEYIISAICHRFDRTKYMMTLELCKDDREL